ncbi:Uncharacterised ACR, YkgG family COG1556 [Anaerobranca californiensis DSM 14826]|jgi:L-lactate utilization protein LutB|uniref:Uncharacterized ACR, YkgG family COG1556 n=1 Tax=Anaerobranca californiensis DSM 14826 TaxID=1120989 RepID=A0A1M6QID7_9FIRM|nr:lactate utilization protein [Anaerobranca californiensis]SHK19880.1 Uncharacterised ACR, YkgG family COG1556 [Anaerobranca californiensis DSM 14826]
MDINITIENLKKKGYSVSYFERSEDATEYLNNIIDGKTVGFGDSTTLFSIKLFEKLKTHNEVFDPQNCQIGENFNDIAKKCLTTEIFITSVNALTQTGEIVNIDDTGNRIAGSLFGHEKVFFVVGINKLVDSLEDAIYRGKNIAAPKNAKRLGIMTPCAIKGYKCYNCSTPDRICNAMIIHYRKMSNIEMEIILINEELGF